MITFIHCLLALHRSDCYTQVTTTNTVRDLDCVKIGSPNLCEAKLYIGGDLFRVCWQIIGEPISMQTNNRNSKLLLIYFNTVIPSK